MCFLFICTFFTVLFIWISNESVVLSIKRIYENFLHFPPHSCLLVISAISVRTTTVTAFKLRTYAAYEHRWDTACPAAPFNPHDHKSACMACDRLWALYMKIALTNNALQLVMKAKDQSWRSMSGHRIRDRDCFHAYDPIRDEDLQEILFISECETQHIDTGWLEVKKKCFSSVGEASWKTGKERNDY